jgi:hypothetical protein
MSARIRDATFIINGISLECGNSAASGASSSSIEIAPHSATQRIKVTIPIPLFTAGAVPLVPAMAELHAIKYNCCCLNFL